MLTLSGIRTSWALGLRVTRGLRAASRSTHSGRFERPHFSTQQFPFADVRLKWAQLQGPRGEQRQGVEVSFLKARGVARLRGF